MTEKNMFFSEFEAVSREAFQKRIEKELQGKDYKKTLIQSNFENIEIEPIYWQEDLKSINHQGTTAGKYPYVRGYKAKGNVWEIRQDIEVNQAKTANKKALDALMKGADSIAFDISKIETSPKLIEDLLKEILPQHIALHFITEKNSLQTLKNLIGELQKRNIDLKQIRGSISFDPLGFLQLNGNWPIDEKTAIDDGVEIIKLLNTHLPYYRGINIGADIYHHAGASIVQELAFSLAQGNFYLNNLIERDLNIDDISAKLQFTFSTGSNYLMEIAKIRAFRMLWARIVEQYKPQYTCSMVTFIHAYTSKFHQTVLDAHNNMLRATSQAMAAAIGGADSIAVSPFDASFENDNDFSTRIARNTQIILAEEAHLNKVADPSGGSYYIENLTDSLAQHAWTLFQEVEKQGGFLNALKNEFIQNQIDQVATNKKQALANHKLVLIGCNKYLNSKENIKEISEKKPQSPYKNHYSVKPIQTFRLAAELENKIKEEIQQKNIL